jgi:dipeptidyl aminopeptidase/acylaminoacyl peptidase
VINRTVSATETYPALITATPGSRPEMIPIPNGGPATYGSMQFSPDGKSLYVTTNANSEFEQLAKIDLASMAYTWLTDDIPWNVDGLDVHPESGDVAFTVNEDGSSVLYVIRGGKRQKLETPLGAIGGIEFSPDGKQIGFTLGLSNRPADAYSVSLADGRLTRWTFSEVGGLNPESFQPAKLVRYKSFDGMEIPAFYYKPAGATPTNPAPVIINIHGGPEAQYRPAFAGNEQFYLNELGVAVIHPNVRGSDGYGKTYLTLDNAAKREDSVRDIGGLLDWIAQQPELDKSRVCVIGGSYGGYMVLASLVHFGDRLKAGVDIVGIASFLTFLKNTAAYRRDLRRVEYGDERDPKMLEVFARIDPLNNAEKIRSALMVVHGRNDPRVPFSEAEQIAAKVRSQGKTVWTVYADNEGHGFAKKANRDYYIAAVVLFLQENVLK